MFPAAELARAMLHLDRFDTDVVTEERVAAEKSLDKLEEFLLSDAGIRILRDEIDDHVDEE